MINDLDSISDHRLMSAMDDPGLTSVLIGCSVFFNNPVVDFQWAHLGALGVATSNIYWENP